MGLWNNPALSIWVTNIAGYSLGALLLFKLGIRHLVGYSPPHGPVRWTIHPRDISMFPVSIRYDWDGGFDGWLVCYCLTSVLNARSSYGHINSASTISNTSPGCALLRPRQQFVGILELPRARTFVLGDLGLVARKIPQ